MATASDYTGLIPSANGDKPKFVAMVALVAGCFADNGGALRSMRDGLDLDTAIGAQLDILGLWIGLSRKVSVPVLSYFSFDIVGLGFDQGNWKGKLDPDSGIVAMDDETYRFMLRAKIEANKWDGSMLGYLRILQGLFAQYGITVSATDNQNMSMTVTLSASPSALLKALLLGGYLPLKPAGVAQTFVFH